MSNESTVTSFSLDAVKKQKENRIIWLVSCLLLMVGLAVSVTGAMLYVRWQGGPNPTAMGEALADVVAPVALGCLIALIARLIASQRKNTIAGLVFSIVVFIGSISSFRTVIRDHSREINVQRAVLSDLQTLFQQCRTGTMTTDFKPHPAIQGDHRQLILLCHGFLLDADRIGTNLQTQLAKLDLESVLESGRLAEASGLGRSRASIQDAVRLYDQATEDVTKYCDTVTEKLLKLDHHDRRVSLFSSGLIDSLVTEQKQSIGVFEKHKEYYQTVDEVLRFLQTRVSKYTIEGDTIIFQRDEDCSRFNSLMEQVKREEKDLERLQRQLAKKLESAQTAFDQLVK